MEEEVVSVQEEASTACKLSSIRSELAFLVCTPEANNGAARREVEQAFSRILFDRFFPLSVPVPWSVSPMQ